MREIIINDKYITVPVARKAILSLTAACIIYEKIGNHKMINRCTTLLYQLEILLLPTEKYLWMFRN